MAPTAAERSGDQETPQTDERCLSPVANSTPSFPMPEGTTEKPRFCYRLNLLWAMAGTEVNTFINTDVVFSLCPRHVVQVARGAKMQARWHEDSERSHRLGAGGGSGNLEPCVSRRAATSPTWLWQPETCGGVTTQAKFEFHLASTNLHLRADTQSGYWKM